MKKTYIVITLLKLMVILLFANTTLYANSFPIVHIEGNTTLERQGEYIFYYMKVIKAYSGAFYIEEGKMATDVFNNVSKRLILEYHQEIDADDFAKTTTIMVKKNISDSAFSTIGDKLERFNALYKDVKPGDRYAITYHPEKGTTLTLNNTVLGTISGYDFSYAIFSIWLGKDPIDTKMKNRLLGL